MRIQLAILLTAACVALALTADAASRQPFTLAITIDKPAVKAGSDVVIKVHLTNTSNRTLDLSANINEMIGVDPNYIFEVRNAFGKDVPQRVHEHPELATGHPVFRYLKPGESVTDEQNLSGLKDFSQPGRYSIQVSRPVSANSKESVVKSNTVSITVTP